MRSVAGGIILAIVLFAGAWVARTEARVTRQVAAAHQRLATLHYDSEDGIEATGHFWNRLPWLTGSASEGVDSYRATVAYWLSRYDSLTEMSNVTGSKAVSDPKLLLVSANATFRAVPPPGADRKPTIDKLDGVIQSYADIIRRDPSLTDAAYNYELVYRIRDGLSKLPPNRNLARERDNKKAAPPPPPADVSVDLPSGPTIHGRPGGPPEGTDMSDFKTISPMRYDEREEQMDPGQGRKVQRKG